LVIGALSGTTLLMGYALVEAKDSTFRWSMSTGSVGLALLGASRATGPLNVLRSRPNRVSADLRRDVGIRAGILSIVQFLVGWQVHMKHRYLYWLREAKGTGALVPRADLFGFANYSGLLAVVVAALLLALSNDRSLRSLGTRRWKVPQLRNYGLLALVVLHGAAYQVIEKRKIPLVILFVAMCPATAVVQAAGDRSRLGERRRVDIPLGGT
jgi:methionine sulfoxide reductase heme-binding subunit